MWSGSGSIPKRGRRIGFIACFGDAKLLRVNCNIVNERRGEFTLLSMNLEAQSISTMEEFHAFKYL